MKRRKKRRESGQSMVEFAIVAPIILTLLCGILDFGWIYMNQYKVEDAAYAGARYASIHASSTSQEDLEKEVEERVKENLYGDGEDVNVTVTVNNTESKVSVQVDYPIRNLTFVAMTFFGKYYDTTSTSVTSM